MADSPEAGGGSAGRSGGSPAPAPRCDCCAKEFSALDGSDGGIISPPPDVPPPADEDPAAAGCWKLDAVPCWKL